MKLNLIAFAALATSVASAQTIVPARNQTLEGTWEFKAEQTAPVLIKLTGMVTYLPSGTLVQSDDVAFLGLQGGPPEASLLQTPGYGQWIRTGDCEFVVNVSKMTFNGRGQFFGITRLRGVLKLNESGDAGSGTLNSTSWT
jgi:hypothetical protein